MATRVWQLIFLAFVAIATGCGSDPPVGRVFGRVSFEGAPLNEGTILFSNADAGVHLRAKIETDGSYVLKTYEANGLPYGTYVVSILPPPADLITGKPTLPIKEFSNIPLQYRDPSTSGLKLTVGEGDNSFDVHMQRDVIAP